MDQRRTTNTSSSKPFARSPTRNTNKRSKAWRYFTESETGDEATCSLCTAQVGSRGGTTSGMWSHLKRYHPDIQELNDVKEDHHLKEEDDNTAFETNNDGDGNQDEEDEEEMEKR